MNFTTYVRVPFVVDAVEITAENIEELAPLVGTLKTGENDIPYIKVDRNKVPSLFKVHIGFFVTKMGGNVRCYSPAIFNKQFVPTTSEVGDFIKNLGVTAAPTSEG